MKVETMDAIKAAPSFAYGGAYLAGWQISEWAAAAALVYTCLLILQLLGRWISAWRARRAK